MAAAMGRWTRKITGSRTALYMGPKNKNKKALAIYNAAHGTDVKRLNYFHMVEFGTYKDPAQPWLRPTFYANRSLIVAGFARHLRRLIEKVRNTVAAR